MNSCYQFHLDNTGDKATIDKYDWDPILYKGSIVAKDYLDWKKIILEQGEVAAKMAQKILKDNIRESTISMRQNYQYIVARKASFQLRNMELPTIYEAFGRATENFIEK